MAPSILKKRKHESIAKPKSQRPTKRFKKQAHYSSSSSSASANEGISKFAAIDLADSASDFDAEDIDINIDATLPNDPEVDDTTPVTPARPKLTKSKSKSNSRSQNQPSSSSDSDSDSDSSASSFASLSSNSRQTRKSKTKRNDPTSFSAAITSILASKLPASTRVDPVLARSSSAHAANTAIRESALEKKARQQLRAEKKALLEKGRVKDVLLGAAVGDSDGADREAREGEGEAGKIAEEEKRLKKTAQRGVMKLFNAVRMAQVRGEEARKEALGKGIVGAKRREGRVGEMSKKGFLELVAAGGTGSGKGKVKGKMDGNGIEEG